MPERRLLVGDVVERRQSRTAAPDRLFCACAGCRCRAATAPDETPDRVRLVDAMEKSGWVQAKAARILGLTPRQIGYALKKHAIPLKKF